MMPQHPTPIQARHKSLKLFECPVGKRSNGSRLHCLGFAIRYHNNVIDVFIIPLSSIPFLCLPSPSPVGESAWTRIPQSLCTLRIVLRLSSLVRSLLHSLSCIFCLYDTWIGSYVWSSATLTRIHRSYTIQTRVSQIKLVWY